MKSITIARFPVPQYAVVPKVALSIQRLPKISPPESLQWQM
jgi:hypothetical protein